jgi:AcrR family transcriptional regulator
MGRPRADTVEQATPERILDAAAVVFARDGLARATLADIALGAGIRRPSLLYHFDSKEQLYAEVVRCTFTRLGESLALPMNRDAPFEARLEDLLRTFSVYLEAHPHHARIVLREMLEDDGPGTVLLREQVAPLLALVVAFLERAGAGLLRPGLPLRAAVLQVVSDVLLQHASGAVGAVMWGAPSVERTWLLCRTLFLADRTEESP